MCALTFFSPGQLAGFFTSSDLLVAIERHEVKAWNLYVPLVPFCVRRLTEHPQPVPSFEASLTFYIDETYIAATETSGARPPGVAERGTEDLTRAHAVCGAVAARS